MVGTVFISTGNLLIGQVLATVYSGIVFAQAFDYFRQSGRADPVGLRAFIGALVLMIAFAVAGQTASLYATVIQQVGVKSPHFPPMHYAPLFTNAIAITLSQAFMVHRAFKVTQSRLIVVILTCLVLFDGASWFIVNCNSMKTNDAPNAAQKLKDVLVLNSWVVINSAVSSATDIIISGVLTWKLLGVKRDGGGFNPSTDSVLSRLLQITVGVTTFL
ncbi:hypothetical protein RQP46_001046 [Phenoliferia psychrophenolica]